MAPPFHLCSGTNLRLAEGHEPPSEPGTKHEIFTTSKLLVVIQVFLTGYGHSADWRDKHRTIAQIVDATNYTIGHFVRRGVLGPAKPTTTAVPVSYKYGRCKELVHASR